MMVGVGPLMGLNVDPASYFSSNGTLDIEMYPKPNMLLKLIELSLGKTPQEKTRELEVLVSFIVAKI